MVIARVSAEVVTIIVSGVGAVGALVWNAVARRREEPDGIGCLTNEDIDELLRS